MSFDYGYVSWDILELLRRQEFFDYYTHLYQQFLLVA